MAKASVTITCSKCGKIFIKEKKCLNRREADSWEEWAERTFDLCPSCYGKQKQEEEKARGLLLSMRLRSPHNPDEDKCVALIYSGDSYPHKDALKEMGATWTDAYPSESDQRVGGLFAFDSQQEYKRWVINCTPDEVDDLLRRSKELGAEVVETIDDVQLATWAAVRNQFAADQAAKQAAEDAEQAEQAEKIAALGPKPQWSDAIDAIWPDGARWNGEFYGGAGCWAIYLNGKKVALSDDLKTEMEQTLRQRREWLAAVEKIKG